MKYLMRYCSGSGEAHELMEKIVTTAYSLLKVRSWMISEYDPVLYQGQDDETRFKRGTKWIWSSYIDALMAVLRDHEFGFDMLGVWLLAEGGALSSANLPSLPQAYDCGEDVTDNGLDVQGDGCFIALSGLTVVLVFGPDEFLAEIKKSFPELQPTV